VATDEHGSEEWKAFCGALRDIKTACDERGLSAPVFAPLLQGEGNYSSPDRALGKIAEWCSLAADAAKNAGFQVVSMEEPFKAEGWRCRFVNRWDQHPDAQCNRVYAEQLAKAIASVIQESGRR
jgi:hypothetical protein